VILIMNDFKIYTLEHKKLWIDDFHNKLEQIKLSDDPKKDNYLLSNLKFDEQVDFSVIYKENDLVAFSSIWNRDSYPINSYRILNRSWKDPRIRWGKPAYFVLSKMMVDHQVDVCKRIGASSVFISSEGRRKLWLKKWVHGANQDGHKFIQINGMVKVCGASYLRCWQNVAYLSLDGTVPDFTCVDYDIWELMVNYDK